MILSLALPLIIFKAFTHTFEMYNNTLGWGSGMF